MADLMIKKKPSGFKLRSIKCPKCGASISLSGGHNVTHVICSYCSYALELHKNNCDFAVFNVRSQIAGLLRNQIAGSSREQRPRIQRYAADDDCRPDYVRRGDDLAKHEVRKQ